MKFLESDFPIIELENRTGSKYIILQADKTGQWVYNDWRGVLAKGDVIEGATLVLEAIRKTCYNKVLNDNTNLLGSWEGANEWIQNEWTPTAKRLGLQYFAHVLSPDRYAQLSAEQMQKNTSGNFEMRLFGDINKAKEWLLSV
jgi:hypothetical protein